MALKVLHGWKNLAESDRGAAVAHGNFDGVHLGHQKVIQDAAAAARSLEAPLGVISYEPHPRLHFQPEAPPFRLTTPHQLARILEGMGVDRLYLLPFGAEMASFTDHDFAREVLFKGLGARHVAVGFDTTFGKDRTGSPDAMRRYGREFGFSVSVAEAEGGGAVPEGQKFSSTGVRNALRDGHPQVAAQILGRPFAIEGVVQKGRQLGRQLGFPTANVPLGDYVAPRFGVYATRTRLKDGRQLPGVANIGVNPTTGEVAPRLEVWLFDFDEDIYGEMIETDLIAFQRDEETFVDAHGDFDVPAMVAQVHRDAALAREILGVR
jgi:riboflavin kinase/FMN adenylyltransferase